VVHFFWADERCVPPESRESNYRLVKELLIDRVPIPAVNVHRMRGEINPVEAAADYEKHLKDFFRPPALNPPAFDLVLLGLGEDGHTASLFPGSTVIHETKRWVAGYLADLQKGRRITLTPPIINAAGTVVFFVTGSGKAAVVRDVIEGPWRPDVLPAQVVRPDGGEPLWMLDRDAAALLKRK
jgi:6-phosphogluconolactonase